MPVIADPNIAEVMRLASLLSIVIHSLLPLPTQSRLICDQAYAIRFSLSRARPNITHCDTKSRLTYQYSRISDLVGSPPDLWISLVNLRVFLLWLRSLPGSHWIYQDHPQIYLTHP